MRLVEINYTYYTQNAHGDVVNLTNADGKVTKTYKYENNLKGLII